MLIRDIKRFFRMNSGRTSSSTTLLLTYIALSATLGIQTLGGRVVDLYGALSTAIMSADAGGARGGDNPGNATPGAGAPGNGIPGSGDPGIGTGPGTGTPGGGPPDGSPGGGNPGKGNGGGGGKRP